MSNFDVAGVSAALHDISNGGAPATPTLSEEKTDGPVHNWVKPQPYIYPSANGFSRPGAPSTEDAGEEVETGSAPIRESADWAHNAKKYEWLDEYGDVGPEVPELEKELFHNETITRRGNMFDRLLSVKVIAEAVEKPAPIRDFANAGLHPAMASNVVDKCGYEVPTPIQAYTIPVVMDGFDLIATAQTGSGKTAAYLIPTISKLMGKAKKLAAARPNTTAGNYTPVRAEPLILIVAPTRELCTQIFDEARRLCYRSMLRPCVAYGGGPPREQRDELMKGCDVLVATPGRLIDIMNDSRVLSLSRLRFTIIDEADEMLQDDWEDEMTKIMGSHDVNEDDNHQYLLFSATFNKRMRKLAKKFLKNDHIRVRIGRSGAVLNDVAQKVVFVEHNLKQKALFDLLITMPPARTMVFVRSKKSADFVDDFLFNQGLPSTSIHSDRTQREREDAMRAFRTGDAPILVTTGVSGRGIDVRNVLHVINYDLPDIEHNGEDEYIHRIGRTARIGNKGLATSFYNEKDEGMAPFITKILVECNQEVPSFLDEFRPAENEVIDWDDDSGVESEEEAGVENSDAAWGTGDAGNTNNTDNAGHGAAAGLGDHSWGAGDAGAAVSTGETWGANDSGAVAAAW